MRRMAEVKSYGYCEKHPQGCFRSRWCHRWKSTGVLQEGKMMEGEEQCGASLLEYEGCGGRAWDYVKRGK